MTQPQEPPRTLGEDAEEQRKRATGGTSVGMDNVSAVSEEYKPPFPFKGRIEKVKIEPEWALDHGKCTLRLVGPFVKYRGRGQGTRAARPTPAAGSIYYLTEDRLRPLDVPVSAAVACIMRLGVGSRELLDRPRQLSDEPSA